MIYKSEATDVIYTLKLNECIDELLENGIVKNIAVRYGMGDKISGEVYRAENGEINEYTKFDMASVTKVLVTTMIALIALDNGKLKLTDKISNFFSCPESHSNTTIKNLLTHTMGIGYKNLCDEKFNYSNIEKLILNIPLDIPVGSNVLYSCPGYILLGKILEKIYGKRLDLLFDEMVAKPLEMNNSSYLPSDGYIINSNTEKIERGIVNDCNCKFLGGVTGNAGVFSNMNDMKKFVKMLLDKGRPLISEEMFIAACQNHTKGMNESRGLGFLLVDDSYNQTGRLFSNGSIGHCGHTGQSFFIDLKTDLNVIILSDMTATVIKNYGTDDYYSYVMKARERLHNAICNDIK